MSFTDDLNSLMKDKRHILFANIVNKLRNIDYTFDTVNRPIPSVISNWRVVDVCKLEALYQNIKDVTYIDLQKYAYTPVLHNDGFHLDYRDSKRLYKLTCLSNDKKIFDYFDTLEGCLVYIDDFMSRKLPGKVCTLQ